MNIVDYVRTTGPAGVYGLVVLCGLSVLLIARPWRARRVLRMPARGKTAAGAALAAKVAAADREPHHAPCHCETRAYKPLPAEPEDLAAPTPARLYAPWRPPQQYRSGQGLLWEDAPPATDGTPSVRVAAGAGLAFPRDDIARLLGLTPIDTPEDDA